MIALARLSLRRPALALLAWTAIAVALGAVGFGVAHQLSPSILVVPGSESARAEHLANAQFGPSQLTPILLRGPQGTLDKDGPALVLALRRAAAHARALGVGHGLCVGGAAALAHCPDDRGLDRSPGDHGAEDRPPADRAAGPQPHSVTGTRPHHRAGLHRRRPEVGHDRPDATRGAHRGPAALPRAAAAPARARRRLRRDRLRRHAPSSPAWA